MDLIIQLKQQHVEILHSFGSIGSELSKTNGGKNYLIEEMEGLRVILTAHLMLEDKLLYPALEKSNSKEARELGKKFSSEMLAISSVAQKFFEEYLSMNLSALLKSSKFKKDVEMIVRVVKKRVNIEETILYPAYERCCKK